MGLSVTRSGYFTTDDWLHAFCLTQTILLAACAVYGPGRIALRLPLMAAWGVSLGFSLARGNLISSQGRVSLEAGAILVAAGTLPPLLLFVLHRWLTGATIRHGSESDRRGNRPGFQLSLGMLMFMMTAFAVTGVVARAAVTAPSDPYGHEYDKLVMHAWLAFFPCLSSAPAFLAVLRPSWQIVWAGCVFFLVAFADPIAFGVFAPLLFEDKALASGLSWNYSSGIMLDSLLSHGQALAATLLYAMLSRAAGFRMNFPHQSNDKKPNPSARPATDAGCVQD